MSLLNILGSIANLAQGNIAEGINGIARNAAQGKEEKTKQKKVEMANQLLQSPENQALYNSAPPEMQAYVQDAASQGNFNEIQQVIAQQKQAQKTANLQNAVKPLLSQMAQKNHIDSSEAQIADVLNQSGQPLQAAQFLQTGINRNESKQRQAQSDLNQGIEQLNQSLRGEAKALPHDEVAAKALSFQKNLSSGGFSLKDLDLPDKEFASKFRMSGNDAKAVKEQLTQSKDAMSSWTSQIPAALQPLAEKFGVQVQAEPHPQALVQDVLSRNVAPGLLEQQQAAEARKQEIQQQIKANEELRPKQAKTAQQLGLTPMSGLKEPGWNNDKAKRLEMLRKKLGR